MKIRMAFFILLSIILLVGCGGDKYYQEGYEKGLAIGYKKGYRKGCEDTLDSIDESVDERRTESYSGDEYAKGYNDGYNAGKEDAIYELEQNAMSSDEWDDYVQEYYEDHFE